MDDILDLIEDVAQSLSLYDVRDIDRAKEPARARSARPAAERCRRPSSCSPTWKRASEILKICDEIDRLESRRRPRDARGHVEAVPRRARRRQLIKLQGDLRAARDRHRPLRGRREHHRRHRARERLIAAARLTRSAMHPIQLVLGLSLRSSSSHSRSTS